MCTSDNCKSQLTLRLHPLRTELGKRLADRLRRQPAPRAGADSFPKFALSSPRGADFGSVPVARIADPRDIAGTMWGPTPGTGGAFSADSDPEALLNSFLSHPATAAAEVRGLGF